MLDTDNSSKNFICLQDALDTSSRRLQDMSSRQLADVFRVTIFCLPRRLSRCLQVVLEDENCYVEDVLNTSPRQINTTNKYLQSVLRSFPIMLWFYTPSHSVDATFTE